MELSERQYERIARWLDGEPVELSAEERAVANEVRDAEALLGGAFGVEVPRGATVRAERRVLAELARPRRRTLRFVAGAAAAAAMVVIAMWSAFDPTRTPMHTQVEAKMIMLSEEFLQPPEDPPDAELALLITQVDQLEAEMLAGPPVPAEDAELKAMEREVDEFWLNGFPVPVDDEFLAPS